MTSPDDTGLGLFDQTASAVGNFPTALRGYDRSAVDEYVRSLEAKAVEAQRRASESERSAAELSHELEEARDKAGAEADYTNLGGHASEILRLAEEQARDVLDRAGVDAERLKEEARREADSTRSAAAREGYELKSGSLAELEKMRDQLEVDGATTLERAQLESGGLIAAARRQGESMMREAEHDAQTTRQQAYLDTEELRRGVEREIADMRQQIAVERERAIAELRRIQEEAATQTSALLAEATEHNQESAARLEADIAEAARIRADALAEAEQVKLTAIKEAEERVEASRKQAAAITERTQQEFLWRKQQLKRETELLSQRKQAVLNQLASLSALAEQTAQSFPDIDDLDEFGAEEGDRTVLRPAGLGPSMPVRDKHSGVEPGSESQQHPEAGPASAVESDETVVMPAARVVEAKPQPAVEEDAPTEDKPGAATDEQDRNRDQHRDEEQSLDAEESQDAEAQLDGDATIVVPPGQMPSGVGHRRPDNA